MANNSDEQYKQATKAVDDAMRWDTLGPNVVKVLTNHKPANDLVEKVVADSIKNNSIVRKNLGTFVDDHDAKRKGRWVDRAIGIAIGAAIAASVTFILTKVL